MDTNLTVSINDLDDETLMLMARAISTEINLLARLYQDYPDKDINETFIEQRRKLANANSLVNNIVYERRLIKLGGK